MGVLEILVSSIVVVATLAKLANADSDRRFKENERERNRPLVPEDWKP